MIISKEIEFKAHSKCMYLKELGYDVKFGENIKVKVSDISKKSSKIILVSCDRCLFEKNITIADYYINFNRNGLFSCKKCTLVTQKDTMMKRYGCEYPLQSKEITDKMKETCLKKYGFENASSSEIIKVKRTKSVNDKYGVDNVFESEIIKSRITKYWIDNYGVDNCAKLNFIKDRARDTSYIRYGESHHMKNEEQFKKHMKNNLKIKKYNDEIYYQGSYELDFLEKYSPSLNIDNGIFIRYYINDEDFKYLSDFYIPDLKLIVEIKSNYTFNLHKEKNIKKREYSIKAGYNFIFIVDKDYREFEKIIKENEDIKDRV